MRKEDNEQTLRHQPVIHYRNTDLDIVCEVDPAILVKGFDTHVNIVNVHNGDDGQYYVLCEDTSNTDPELNISRLLDVVDNFTESARKVWNRCSKRDFNIGYDCGDGPWGFNQGLSNQTLRRIVECGATLSIALYPFRPETEGEETS